MDKFLCSSANELQQIKTQMLSVKNNIFREYWLFLVNSSRLPPRLLLTFVEGLNGVNR